MAKAPQFQPQNFEQENLWYTFNIVRLTALNSIRLYAANIIRFITRVICPPMAYTC
jgi:hypothetical protein